MTTITRYMDTTNDQTHVLRYRITQVSDSRRFESNYWFIDDLVYYTKRTETMAGNAMTAADKLQESKLKLILTEGIISDGLCLQYDRERNQVLDGEIKLDFQPEDLAGMYESGEHMLPEDAAANEDAGYAMVVYRNFLESDEMYEFTATNSYPRGDSQAVYSIGDMNGDGLVDLWIDGGGDRSIYTLRGGELYRMQFFKSGRFDSEFKFEQEGQTYEIVPGSEGEEDSYFAYEKAGRNDDRKRGDSRSISMAEWHEWRRMIDRLLLQ